MAQNPVMRNPRAFRDLGHCHVIDTASAGEKRARGLRGRTGPDDEVGDAGDGEKNCGDQEKEAQPGKFFAFGRVMSDLEKEQQKAGDGEKNEPDRDADEFAGDGAHVFTEVMLQARKGNGQRF